MSITFLTAAQGHDCTPITTRQLESMIRLAEARAKCELRESVTAADAMDVVDIMKESLFDIFSDEFGHVDFRRSRGLSKSKQVRGGRGGRFGITVMCARRSPCS